MNPTYVLLTAARNEARFIGNTLESVIAQTVLPTRWIIVSDGSTDGTDEIVARHAASHPWIELVRMPEHRDRQFAAKAHCINAAYDRVRPLGFDVVANLDADVSFAPDFFEFLLGKFSADSSLGVAGTAYIELDAHQHPVRNVHAHTDLNHVSGQCQVFRRACFEDVGGYVPIKGGAIDWVAVTSARMRHWHTRTFPEKTFLHHRPMGTANNGTLRARFHYGRKAYYVGGHPAWEMLRGIYSMKTSPVVVGGLMFQLGYVWAAVTRMPRPVSSELIAFHRAEQLARLKRLFSSHEPTLQS